MSFFGVQRPWYTVGWQMAVVIEKTMGQDVLIASMCDHTLQQHFTATTASLVILSSRKAPPLIVDCEQAGLLLLCSW
jgi:hypothetical protein